MPSTQLEWCSQAEPPTWLGANSLGNARQIQNLSKDRPLGGSTTLQVCSSSLLTVRFLPALSVCTSLTLMDARISTRPGLAGRDADTGVSSLSDGEGGSRLTMRTNTFSISCSLAMFSNTVDLRYLRGPPVVEMFCWSKRPRTSRSERDVPRSATRISHPPSGDLA